jgi:hypothetical protein
MSPHSDWTITPHAINLIMSLVYIFVKIDFKNIEKTHDKVLRFLSVSRMVTP